MALVEINGTFMGAQIKTTEFDGNKKTSLIIDVYQQQSDLNNKTVQLRSDDIALYQKLSNDYTMGSPIHVTAAVNAYKNQAYFKLVKINERD